MKSIYLKPYIFFILFVFLSSLSAIDRNKYWQGDVTLWGDAVDKSSYKGRPNYNLGLAWFEEKKFSLALTSYQKYSELVPLSSQGKNNLGFTYYKLGNMGLALKNIIEATELDNANFEALNNLGLLYHEFGNLNQALIYYNKSIEVVTALKKNYSVVYNNRGQLYGDKGLKDKSKSDFIKSIKMNYSVGESHNNLAIVLASDGDLDGAVREFTIAKTFSPDNHSIYFNLALIYNLQNLNEKAKLELLEVLKLNPNDEDAKELLLELSSP